VGVTVVSHVALLWVPLGGPHCREQSLATPTVYYMHAATVATGVTLETYRDDLRGHMNPGRLVYGYFGSSVFIGRVVECVGMA